MFRLLLLFLASFCLLARSLVAAVAGALPSPLC